MTEEEIAALPIFDPTRAANLLELMQIVKRHCIIEAVYQEITAQLDQLLFPLHEEISQTGASMRLDFLVGGWYDDEDRLLPACVMRICADNDFRHGFAFGMDDDKKVILGYSVLTEQRFKENMLPPRSQLN